VFDASGKKVVEKTVNVVAGEQRLELNMQIPKGNGYKLLSDLHVGLWRDKTGASFPYSVGSDVSITGWANAAGKGGTEYYYFFYDWEILTGSVGCVSERVKVDVVTDANEDILANTLIYPNPANNYIRIINLPSSDCDICLYNVNMQQIKQISSNGSVDMKINLDDLTSGVYFCKISLDNKILNTEKIIIVK
jgi:hypothetical protein